MQVLRRARNWVLSGSSRGLLISLISGILITTSFWIFASTPATDNKPVASASAPESQAVETSEPEQNSDLRTMPPLLGLRTGEFEEKLSLLGVDQWSTFEVASDQPAGVVVKTSPGPGEEFSLLHVNTEDINDINHSGVRLYISKGKAESDQAQEPSQIVENVQDPGTSATGQAVMPNLLGLTKQNAESALRAIGIRTFSYRQVPSTKPAGTVVAQSHPQGTKLNLALSNESYDPNNPNPNHIEFSLSTGYEERPSSAKISSEDSTFSWATPSSRANWGFYEPSVQDGVLTIRVDVKFGKDSEILLDPSVAYATINGDLRTGFMSNLPKTVSAAAGSWIAPISFKIKISNLGVNEPKTATIRLRVKEGSEGYIETLKFTFGTWK